MKSVEMILANDFCIHHNIELSFIRSLKEYGMITTVTEREMIYLPVSELPLLEKIIRLHFELDINLEGIETIKHLLDRMEQMQGQITELTNRLRAFEGRPGYLGA